MAQTRHQRRPGAIAGRTPPGCDCRPPGTPRQAQFAIWCAILLGQTGSPDACRPSSAKAGLLRNCGGVHVRRGGRKLTALFFPLLPPISLVFRLPLLVHFSLPLGVGVLVFAHSMSRPFDQGSWRSVRAVRRTGANRSCADRLGPSGGRAVRRKESASGAFHRCGAKSQSD